MAKVTAYTVANLRKAKVGQRESLQLTDADKARLAKIDEERLARLARIAARARGEEV